MAIYQNWFFDLLTTMVMKFPNNEPTIYSNNNTWWTFLKMSTKWKLQHPRLQSLSLKRGAEPKNCLFKVITKLGCSQICGWRRRIEETYETANAEISLYDPKNPTP